MGPKTYNFYKKRATIAYFLSISYLIMNFTSVYYLMSINLQELFEEIDQEKDGEIYLKEVVYYLKAMNEELDKIEVSNQNR